MKKAVAGIVLYNEKVLIGKKVIKEGHFLSGGWHIPGGHVGDDETEEDALIREYKEETNLDIQILNKVVSIEIPNNNVEVHWYICEAISTDLLAKDDLDDAKFVNKNEVQTLCDDRAIELWPEEVLNLLSK